MRKIRAWAFLAVMGLFVFSLSGCGGGSLDANNSSQTTTPTIPNDYPDTYNTGEILKGTWYAIDESNSFIADDFTFRLNYAVLRFESTDIKSTSASSSITSSQDWQVYYINDDGESINVGSKSLGLDFERKTGTMIHQGQDRWRCSVVDENGNVAVMNITVNSGTLISVRYQGSTGALFAGLVVDYDFTLTFRKVE